MTSIPTRPTFAPLRWLARCYLRMRLRSVEFDLEVQAEQAKALPMLTQLYEREAAQLRVQLALLND
jgi:hypothetical protein